MASSAKVDSSRVTYTQSISTKSYKISFVLAIISFIPFLSGFLDFYIGKGGKGILYTFTAGLFWIGNIYNLLMLMHGKLKDGEHKQIKNVVAE